MEGNNTPEAWYRSLPTITRFIVTASFFVTLALSLRLFDTSILLLDWHSAIQRFQFWRLLTNYLFYGNFSIHWLMMMYFLVTFSSKLERNEIFSNSPGSYLYFVLFQMIALDLCSYLLYFPKGTPILGPSLSFAIIYYWSRREAFAQVGIWGFTVQGYQFPFALLILDLLMGLSIWDDLMGLFTGHLYFFLREVCPTDYGVYLLDKTPYFLDSFMLKVTSASWFSGRLQRPATASASRAPVPGQEFSGRGYRLGS